MSEQQRQIVVAWSCAMCQKTGEARPVALANESDYAAVARFQRETRYGRCLTGCQFNAIATPEGSTR